jgi:hypothetical protein
VLAAAYVSTGAAIQITRPHASPESTPVVAVVSQTGQLLPLAAYADGNWKMLPWPGISSAYDLRRAPLVPATVDAIPRDWFTPLKALPASWRLQTLDGHARDIHLLAPARWDDGTAWSVGIRVDYRVRENGEEFNAGIAVAGAATALPVRRLDRASAEWRAIVRSHVSAFGAAERAGGGPSGSRDPAPRERSGVRVPASDRVGESEGRSPSKDDEELSKQLLKGDVDLREVRVGPDSAYYYFFSTLLRPSAVEPRTANCSGTIGMHVGLLARRRSGPFAIMWIRGRTAACADGSDAVDVVGGVKVRDGVRFVVKRGGPDWSEFDLADPAGAESELLARPVRQGRPEAHARRSSATLPVPDERQAICPLPDDREPLKPASASRAAAPATSAASTR